MDGADPVGAWKPVEFKLDFLVSPEDRAANIDLNAGRNLPHVQFKGICICASGPSLADHLDDIRARRNAGWSIATMNGSHNFLIDHGIVPDYYFQIDARKGNLSFLERANAHTTYIIASQCQLEVFEALAGRKVKLWHVFHDEIGLAALRRNAPDSCMFAGAYNVGQSCLNPIFGMGYRRWALYGYDGSMRDGEKHAFDQQQNAGEEVRELMFLGKHYYATPTMAHHAETFFERYSLFRGLQIDIEIIGDGLLPDIVRDREQQREIASQPAPPVPTPKPRRKPVERLQIVCWKWKGHISYFPDDVNVWASMVDRWLDRPHELVCITDEPEGIDGAVRIVPLWRDHFEHGRDWHRVKIFAEEMADLIGPRFVSMDLDTVVCGPLDPLFPDDAPFKAWQDPFRDQYCTALFMMDAGAYPHVLDTFDAARAMHLRTSGLYGGYDQAWISHVLPGQPMWTAEDGVLSFKGSILKAETLEDAAPGIDALPAGARIINFHGKYNPRDAAVQAACPWVIEHWQ